MLSFQQLILRLNAFWDRRGCVLLQPYDMEVGAGTFHTATFLRAIGPEPWNAAYVQPSRRPKDGRYGENPNRLQHYYQYQVALKPSPADIQEVYLESLTSLGIDPTQHDIRFVEDDWESPTLGAWGLGWEVWLDGMEVTQFTYFQEVGSLTCKPVLGEITYGLERLAMYLQGVENVYDLVWTEWQERGGQRLTGSTADTRPGTDTSDVGSPAQRQPAHPHAQHWPVSGPKAELNRRFATLHASNVGQPCDSLCVTPDPVRGTNRPGSPDAGA